MPEFARHIKPVMSLAQLALPEARILALRQIVSSSRNANASALFTGPDATGKTRAAEALAHEMQTDLYRIDLAAVVNKWIGETEKNLKQLFDSAAKSGAVLLFDEADALFGKRTGIKDSHDRFANIESHPALIILSVETKDSLDPALLARAKYVVDFPH